MKRGGCGGGGGGNGKQRCAGTSSVPPTRTNAAGVFPCLVSASSTLTHVHLPYRTHTHRTTAPTP